MIVGNVYWDNFSLLLIVSNSLIILSTNSNDINNPINQSDSWFLFIYTFEMLLKIFAYGFVIPEGSYLRESWNVLDFLIIVIGITSFILRIYFT